MRQLQLLLPLLILTSCTVREAPVAEMPFDPVFEFAANCVPYHTGDLTDTPAPRGYKAFYISHYGRHGSRIYIKPEAISPIIDLLEAGEKDSALNELGTELLDSLRSEEAALSGILGQITERGALEHKHIASRMYRRFPHVFAKGGDVYCLASTRQRCLASMANFTSELKGLAPESEFYFHTGPGYQSKLIREEINPEIKAFHNAGSEAQYDSLCSRRAIVERLFRVVPKMSDDTVNAACKALYNAWFTCASVDSVFIDILKYLTLDEIKALHISYNDWFYVNHCKADDYTGPLRVSYADETMMDIIHSADAAIAGNGRAADLRFGHDTGLTPLLCLMKVEGFDRAYGIAEAYSAGWNLYEKVPLAANLQIVFYRGRSEEVLVKLLLNEEEIHIPLLVPVSGPYYKWSEVKAFWLSELSDAVTVSGNSPKNY